MLTVSLNDNTPTKLVFESGIPSFESIAEYHKSITDALTPAGSIKPTFWINSTGIYPIEDQGYATALDGETSAYPSWAASPDSGPGSRIQHAQFDVCFDANFDNVSRLESKMSVYPTVDVAVDEVDLYTLIQGANNANKLDIYACHGIGQKVTIADSPWSMPVTLEMIQEHMTDQNHPQPGIIALSFEIDEPGNIDVIRGYKVDDMTSANQFFAAVVDMMRNDDDHPYRIEYRQSATNPDAVEFAIRVKGFSYDDIVNARYSLVKLPNGQGHDYGLGQTANVALANWFTDEAYFYYRIK